MPTWHDSPSRTLSALGSRRACGRYRWSAPTRSTRWSRCTRCWRRASGAAAAPEAHGRRARDRARGHRAAPAGAAPDAAAILYTSGTTGSARGAVLTRRALLASAQASAANLGWQDDDCWLLAMPLARVGGLSIVTRCLAARRTRRARTGVRRRPVAAMARGPPRHAALAGADDAGTGAGYASRLAPTGAPACASAGRGRGLAALARARSTSGVSRS